MIPFAASPARIARRKQAEMSTEASKALMKWLGKTLGSKAKHVYVVGGAVRNFKLDQPIKDIDMVVDSINLGHDAAWVAQQLARWIPAPTNIAGPDNLRVTKVNVTGPWVLDGFDLNGETLDIVDARKEEYEVDPATGEYVGHKPTKVEPTTMEVDVSRREFTFNTLMWRLSDLAKGVDQAEIIDMTGCGLRDLENREMRCPMDPDEVFALDPTRIIRTIKFAFKYGMKLPPDVKAAAKRQAKGLKRIPAKAYGAIKDIALESPDYKKALDVMADLGVTDVIAEIMKSDKQFRNSLLNYAEKKGVSYLFDLMDVGIPVSAPMSFLSRPQQARLREIAALMDREDAMAFLGALRNPGKAYQDGRFIPSLAQEKGIERNQMGKFMPAVNAAAREALLAEPTLLENPSALKGVVRSRVIKASRKAPTNAASPPMKLGLRIEQRKGDWPTAFWRGVVLSLCKKMGVDPSKLKVQFRKRLSDPNADADYHFSGVLRIKPPAHITATTMESLFESMAHELQHAKQYQTGQYQAFQRNEAGERGSTWEGTFYPEDYPYRDRPWEVDARKAGERYGPPLYQEMKSKGLIPLSKLEKLRSKQPFEGPTVGDWGVLTDEEQDEDIRLRKTSFKDWMELWRERYKTGWRGLDAVRSQVGKVASRKATTDLGVLLETMEVPDMRRDLSSKSNLRWLLRNLRVNNGSHPQIDEAMAEIKALVRGKRADLTARWGTTLLAGGDKIPGGRAEGKSPSDFDPKQIEMGTGVEMEHTTDRAVAREVAMDHLTEIPDYYSRLDKMEGEAGVKHAWVQRLQMKREAAAQLRFAWADDRG